MSDSRDATPSDSNSTLANRGWVAALLDWLKSVDSWWTVLLLLFCVTGVLGLPILWLSRAYGSGSKIVLSILVTLYTAFLFWLVYLVWLFAYNAVMQGA